MGYTAEDSRDLELKKLSLAVNQSRDWIVITDKEGTIEYVNDTVMELTGYNREEIIGQKPSLWKSDKHSSEFYRVMWETIKSGQPYRNIIINRKKNGELFYSEQSITPVVNEKGEVTNFVSVGKDITRSRELQNRLKYVEKYDLLTDLPNRNHFQETIKQWQEKKEEFAVIVTDLSRLNYINETYGMETGDELLRECGRRFVELMGNKENIARLGGDEFGLLYYSGKGDISKFMEQLLLRGEEYYFINDQRIVIPLKAGAAKYPEDGKNARELLSRANIALSGTRDNKYCLYSQKMEKKARRLTFLKNRLHRALEKDEFEMYYQPYYNLQSGKRAGMEALLRWRRGDEMVSPAEFVPVLEESGLIIPAGELILEKVFKKVKELQLPAAINLSPVQFREKGFFHRTIELASDAGIDPGLIGFEITETALMENIDKALQLLKDLKEEGFSIAIDDFGTGYSSLSYLSQLPLDYLKIDLSFVRDLEKNPNNRVIVKVIISLAHQLGLQTIAEGVETKEQLQILTKLGADIGQGFYWQRPLAETKIKNVLR